MSSLYLHIPFCQRKCSYCDFYSQPGNARQIADYVTLLRKDLQLQQSNHSQFPPLDTLFLGGGTPSLLRACQLEEVFAELHFAPQAEISLEANPGTITPARLKGYRQAGLNRLSIGVQSFQDAQLRRLGRIHTAKEAYLAFEQARTAEFSNISLDLMFALPGQQLADLERELEIIVSLAPEHVSLYGLTYEEGTPFAALLEQGELTECAEELYEEEYRLIHDVLAGAGYEHYEISNFARPGYRCRHNQVYWQRRTCLAAGCGAHSFFAQNWGERWAIEADLERYRSKLEQGLSPATRIETFDQQQAMEETLYLALRTADGLDCADFQNQFNCHPQDVFHQAVRSCGSYLDRSQERWRFNLSGWLIYNHLIGHFFS